MSTEPHYQKPGWFTRNLFNPMVMLLTRLGMSMRGSRVLEVRGRRTGAPRRNPVNLLSYGGHEYLVAPRGTGDWVRNVRAAKGELDLLLGNRRQHFRAVEIPEEEKPPILREYLRRWKAEVGVFFEGVTADSDDAELARIAPRHPVFRLEPPKS